MSDDLLQLRGEVSIQAAADGSKPKRFSMVAYSGGPMSPPGYPNVIIDLSGADVSGDVPILAGHDASLDSIVGQGQATIRDHQLHVTGTITAATEAGQKVLALAESGISLQASVGFAPDRREHVPADTNISVNGRELTAGNQGITIIRSGRLREVSLLPIGADPNTQVQIAAKADLQKGTQIMAETITPDVLQAERNRTAEINAKCDALVADQLGKMLPERLQTICASAISDGWSIEKTENELLRAERDAYRVERIRSGRPQTSAILASSQDVGTEGGDILQAGLLLHLGHEELAVKTLGEPATNQARRLRLNSLHDIMRCGLQQQGVEVPAGRDSMIRAAFSTNTIPGILSNVANKISMESYRAAPSVARVISRKLSANDFKTHTGYRLTANATFDEVGNAGEIKHGDLGESSFTYKVATFARMFGLTRQDVINDDLGKFEEVPRLLGRGAAIKLEQLFWTLVLANTGNFFHGDNNNLIDDPLDITGLGSAVETLRKLVDAAGDPISITPKYLVCPPELETTADQLFASTNVVYGGDAAVPDSNPYKGKYQPQVSPYLSNSNYSGYSTTGWYLFGDPGDVAAFGIAYLDGQEAPTIEQADTDFNTLGIQFRGYLDFGVCQIDAAGAIKSSGDA